MIVAVGGDRRKAGKTTLVCSIVGSLSRLRWTAVKIGHRHAGAPWSIEEELARDGLTDTSRYLLAGAGRALWVQAGGDHLREAVRAVVELTAGGNTVIESSSLVDVVLPDLYLMVLGVSGDPKEAAERRASRADFFVRLREPGSRGESAAEWQGRPLFTLSPGEPLPAALGARILQLARSNDTDTPRRPPSPE